MPVFTTTHGGPIEPKTFSPHWYDCLRALGLRVRGLYCTKDTYVSRALRTVRDPRWVEKRTAALAYWPFASAAHTARSSAARSAWNTASRHP
jgi:hypothetical protein